jgi:hypothetical protein
MADHGGQITLAAHLNSDDAEAALGIVEGDALDRARERLDEPARVLDLPRSDHLVHAPARTAGTGPLLNVLLLG